ncbi:MAG: hypothetical protein PHW78_02305 [Macromonas bipunctata]|nr:hypothetical protein [Macromonas bipunctata]
MKCLKDPRDETKPAAVLYDSAAEWLSGCEPEGEGVLVERHGLANVRAALQGIQTLNAVLFEQAMARDDDGEAPCMAGHTVQGLMYAIASCASLISHEVDRFDLLTGENLKAAQALALKASIDGDAERVAIRKGPWKTAPV